MSKWKYTLHITDLRDRAHADEITPVQFIEAIVTRLKLLKVSEEHDVDGLIDEIEDSNPQDWDEFDDVMNTVYDWGDTQLSDKWPFKKLCWIF